MVKIMSNPSQSTNITGCSTCGDGILGYVSHNMFFWVTFHVQGVVVLEVHRARTVEVLVDLTSKKI